MKYCKKLPFTNKVGKSRKVSLTFHTSKGRKKGKLLNKLLVYF